MLLSHMLLNIVCAPLSHFWLLHPEMTLCHAASEIRITLQNRQQCDVDLDMSGMVLHRPSELAECCDRLKITAACRP